MAERPERKKGFNNSLRIATILGFKIHDLQQLYTDYVGHGFDPDIVNPNVVGVADPMKWPEFQRLCYDFLKVHPLFIEAGILRMKGEMETGETAIMTQPTLILNIQTLASEYREQNPKPTQEAIAAAAAVRENREADLTQLRDLKTELKEKDNQITNLKVEVNNKQSPGKKMQSQIQDKLLANNDLKEAMQWCTDTNAKNKEHQFAETKMRLLGTQAITTTGAIAANAKGDGNLTTETLLATYNQFTRGINATDTVPKEQYDNDIKRLQQKFTDSDNKCIGMGAKMYTSESMYNNSEQKNKELKKELTVVKKECEKWKGDAGRFERELADETAKFEGAKDVLARVRGFHITERKTDANRYQALLEENLKLQNRSL